MFFILLFFLIIALFLEGSLTTLPLTLVVLLLGAIFLRDWRIFPLAFFAGIALDFFTLRPLGSTSLFFLLLMLLVLLYQRKYEIQTLPFVGVAGFTGGLIYLGIFVQRDILLQTIISSVITLVLFLPFRKISFQAKE